MRASRFNSEVSCPGGSAPHLRRGVLQSRGPSLSRTESVGPGSAEQRCTLYRVRDTDPPDSRFNIQTAERHESALSRRGLRPSFASIALEKPRGRGECRMPAAPAASCAIGVIERTRVTTSTPESPGIPARNGFTAYVELSPVTGLFCHRHPQSKVLSLPGWANKAPRT